LRPESWVFLDLGPEDNGWTLSNTVYERLFRAYFIDNVRFLQFEQMQVTFAKCVEKMGTEPTHTLFDTMARETLQKMLRALGAVKAFLGLLPWCVPVFPVL
jgi:hypothetical protein